MKSVVNKLLILSTFWHSNLWKINLQSIKMIGFLLYKLYPILSEILLLLVFLTDKPLSILIKTKKSLKLLLMKIVSKLSDYYQLNNKIITFWFLEELIKKFELVHFRFLMKIKLNLSLCQQQILKVRSLVLM